MLCYSYFSFSCTPYTITEMYVGLMVEYKTVMLMMYLKYMLPISVLSINLHIKLSLLYLVIPCHCCILVLNMHDVDGMEDKFLRLVGAF